MVESKSIDSEPDTESDGAPDHRAGGRSSPSQSHDPMTEQAIEEDESSIELASKTDVGQVRTDNEDSCKAVQRSDGALLLVVADGMGGHRGGATASSTAVDTIVENFEADSSADIQRLLRRSIESANARIFAMSQTEADLEGMGTTVVAFVIDAQHRATVAHVGDSRAYRYRQGHLDALTTDHSVVAEMQRRGLLTNEEAAAHPRRNEILRSVGVLEEVEIEVAAVEVAPGDRFLLCSDGLSGVVDDDEIAAVVQSKTPLAAVETLIGLANERGGPDNITVQVLEMPPSATEGDPEATTPVELSDIGIEAIETKRRERVLFQRAGIVAIALAIAAGVAVSLAWYFLGSAPPAAPEPTPASEPAQATGADAPRRGIPR